ncbi:MAG TPA: ABC transporter permease [Candidatus Acidoferrum sp.]|nr:ABC transporter permease [Candidatus Acidoferrum sp.]
MTVSETKNEQGLKQEQTTNPRGTLPWFLITPNLLLIGLFMLGPLLLLARISLEGYQSGQGIIETWQLSNYSKFLFDPFYRQVLVGTLILGAEVTALCLVLGYPLAYSLSRARGLKRAVLYFCILMPLLTSTVVRTFGWMILLANNGFINKTLMSLHLIESPVRLMYNVTGVIVALVEVLLPFMVLALDTALLNIDLSLYEAARNLGARGPRIFLRITLPLSLPGVVSGCVLVFTGALSAFVTPTLIAGARLKVMSTVIYQQAMALLDWPFGAAIAFVMLVTIAVLLVASLQLSERLRDA